MLFYPSDELVPGHCHPSTDAEGGEALAVQQGVAAGGRDAQHLGYHGRAEKQRKFIVVFVCGLFQTSVFVVRTRAACYWLPGSSL